MIVRCIDNTLQRDVLVVGREYEVRAKRDDCYTFPASTKDSARRDSWSSCRHLRVRRRPGVENACGKKSLASNRGPYCNTVTAPWHARAGGGAIHSIKTGASSPDGPINEARRARPWPLAGRLCQNLR
jgi:hypothetical protein